MKGQISSSMEAKKGCIFRAMRMDVTSISLDFLDGYNNGSSTYIYNYLV